MDEGSRHKHGSVEKMGEQIGGAAGRAVGRGTEMAMDAMASMFGSAVDAMGQWWSSAEATRAARSFDSRDRNCREHFQKSSSSASSSPSPSSSRKQSYEDVRPLYQFGHTARHNPAYEGRSFDEVEGDLQRAWDDERSSSYGEWPEIRGYVGFGYAESSKES